MKRVFKIDNAIRQAMTLHTADTGHTDYFLAAYGLGFLVYCPNCLEIWQAELTIDKEKIYLKEKED